VPGLLIVEIMVIDNLYSLPRCKPSGIPQHHTGPLYRYIRCCTRKICLPLRLAPNHRVFISPAETESTCLFVQHCFE
jgi:hypothetical protein